MARPKPRLCEQCGKPLSHTKRADARYHDSCKDAAYRERQQERALDEAQEWLASLPILEQLVVTNPETEPFLAEALKQGVMEILRRHRAEFERLVENELTALPLSDGQREEGRALTRRVSPRRPASPRDSHDGVG